MVCSLETKNQEQSRAREMRRLREQGTSEET